MTEAVRVIALCMGAALFSGPRMTGTLTGNEVSLLCLMTGKASKRVSVIDGEGTVCGVSVKAGSHLLVPSTTAAVELGGTMQLVTSHL